MVAMLSVQIEIALQCNRNDYVHRSLQINFRYGHSVGPKLS